MVETTGRGTLGQQQQVMMQEQQQGRVTRSDRKKAVEGERIARYRFETGKAEAERLRTEVFIDKNIEEQYDHTYYVPTKYLDRWGNPTNSWNRLSEKQKANILKSYWSNRYGYGQALSGRSPQLKAFTEQRTKTTFDPFTFEEYEGEYEKLSPDVQQFFSSPVEIKAEKQRQKEVDLGVAQTKIEAWQERIAREEERKKRQDDWWDEYTRRDSYRRLSSERKAEERAKYDKRMREYDNRIDKYKASISYLQGEWGKIGEGYKLQDIISYAQDKAHNDWLRWDSKDNARYEFELGLAKNDESLMKNLETLGFKDKTKVSFTDYQKSADKFNKDLAHIQQLQKWAGQKGFENLPTYAQDKIRSSTGLPKGEIPTFDTRGKLTNVQSAVFGGVYSAKDYETKVIDYKQKVEQAGGWDSYVQQQKVEGYKALVPDEEEDKKVKIPFKFIDAPMGYGSGMTINAFDTGKLLVADDFGTQTSVDPTIAGLKWVGGKIGEGFNWIDDRVHYTGEWKGDLSANKVPLFQFGKLDAPTQAEATSDYLSGELGSFQQKRRDSWIDYLKGEGSLESFKSDLETKHSEKYEQEFWKSDIGREAYFGEFDEDQFADAQRKFSESERGKELQKEYETEFGEGYKDLQTLGGTGWRGVKTFFGGGGEMFGYNLGQLGLSLTRSPTRVGTTTAGIVTGTKILSGLPTLAKTGLSAGFTAWGTATAFNPTKTFDQRFAGFFTASIGAFSLTKAGIKYMRTPSVERVAVGSKMTLKTQAMGFDNVKHLDKAGKVGSKVVYSEQKLSQVGVGGSRAVVSQRWRDLFNKYIAPLNKRIAIEHVGGSGMKSVLRFSIKPSTTRVASVYEGVPAWQPAQFMKVEGIRGSTLVKTAPSGYEKAMKLLKEYGASDYQARSTLRYYAPRVYETWINKGVIVPSKDTARGIFSTEIRQPKVDLGGGIKTRAGQPIKDLIAFERKVIPSKQLANMGKDLVGFKETAIRFRTIGDKPVSQFEMTSGKAIGKASDIYKGEWKGFEYDWRKLGSIAQQRGSLKLDFGKNYWSVGLSNEAKMSAKGSYLIDSKSFKPATDKFFIQSTKVTKTTPRIDPTSRQFQATQSEFYGQGMYERTDSVSGRMFAEDKAQSVQAMQQVWMKAPLQVDFASPKVKFGKMFEVQTMSQTALDVGLLTQVGLKMQQKTDQKQDVQLKTLLKQQLGLKQQVALRQDTQMKQAQTTATTLQAPSSYQTQISLKDPMFKTPIMPKMRNYFVPAKASQKEKIKSRIRQMKMKEIRFEGLLPDFTSRALGLSPKEVGGVGDAMREIRKIQTGLGIRTGARFKKSNNKRGNISEKNLLRGIMN